MGRRGNESGRKSPMEVKEGLKRLHRQIIDHPAAEEMFEQFGLNGRAVNNGEVFAADQYALEALEQEALRRGLVGERDRKQLKRRRRRRRRS